MEDAVTECKIKRWIITPGKMSYRTTMYGAPTKTTYTQLCRHMNADARLTNCKKEIKVLLISDQDLYLHMTMIGQIIYL